MRYLTFLLTIISLNGYAQCKEFTISVKGDTLNCVDMKGMKQGPWVIKVENVRGERGYEEEGFFKDGKKEGTWRQFSLEGDLIAIENYNYGMKSGKCTYFTASGLLLREESWRAIDPKNPYDTVPITDVNDPSKIIRYEIIKVEPNSYKHGTWKYYNTMTGAVEETEQWVMNKPKAEAIAAADDMAPIDVSDNKQTAKTTEKKLVTKPKEILEYEKKNSGKKKVKVRDGRTGG